MIRLENIKDIEVLKDVSLKNYNTYKIDAFTKYLVKVYSIDALIFVLRVLREENISYFILGAGSNVILGEYFDGVIIKIVGLDYVKVQDKEVFVGASTMMGKLTKETIKHSLTGLEWAINIPGTVGGSIVGNAGAYQSEIFDALTHILVLTKNLETKIVSKEEIEYQYRNTNIRELGFIVLEGVFSLKKGNLEEAKDLIKKRCEKRKDTQPLNLPSAGSVFRNPENDYAGRLIEASGLKGKKIGGAEISKKHANFIVNTGNATSNDIKNLIKLIQDTVYKNFGISLILEQEIVDWKNEYGENKNKNSEKTEC